MILLEMLGWVIFLLGVVVRIFEILVLGRKANLAEARGSAAAGASTAKSISPARRARSAVLESVMTRTLISSKLPLRVPL